MKRKNLDRVALLILAALLFFGCERAPGFEPEPDPVSFVACSRVLLSDLEVITEYRTAGLEPVEIDDLDGLEFVSFEVGSIELNICDSVLNIDGDYINVHGLIISWIEKN
ncbi:MAG TPA: hypothetical protein VMV36_01545 [Ignavibacteriaceae bacterium]|nr:hypothetical protein [Ignavibacteriaceae bacterium]